jgi:MFS family permease
MSASTRHAAPAPVGHGASLPGARSALLLLLLINLFNYMDRQLLSAVVGPIKRTFFGDNGQAAGDTIVALMEWCERHLGFKPEDALVGLLGTAFMVVYMVAAPVFARLSEQRSRWLIVGIGVVLWSLASGASGLATTFVALLLTRCFVGVGEAAWGPVSPAILSDMYPVESRGRVLAWFCVAIPVGSALGYVLGGWVANSSIDDWGAAVVGIRAESWRWAFYVVAPPGIVLGLVCFFRRETRHGTTDAAPRAPVPWAAYLELLRTPSYVLDTLGMTAMTFAIGGIAFWMPYYLESRPGAPAASTLIFGAVVVVAGLSATLIGGVVGDRLRGRYGGSYFLVSGTAMLLGFPIILAALQAPFPWIWVLIFLTVFCLFFNTGPTNTILANVTHPSIRSVGFALNIFVIHAFGDVISPVIIGFLTDRLHDMSKAFLVIALMFPVSGALWLWGARHLQRDTKAD